ncbi:hypothetical protein [Hansschlegelia sp.]|uniref:hypothetical protein n=1 Tax=Hansschlegelia sp. TaxID=2041892 RepID=UPI002D7E57DF|nr:hypothetical protein [Hansschlegelia sp.]
MKKVLGWLVWVLAGVGLTTVIVLSVYAWLRSPAAGAPHPDFVDKPIVSPDGAFKAVRLNYNGGGAIAPYCYDRLAVLKGDAPISDAGADAAMVFGSDCASFWLDKGPAIERSPKIEWTAANELRVTFSINRTANKAGSFRLRKQDATGSIRISFIAHD